MAHYAIALTFERRERWLETLLLHGPREKMLPGQRHGCTPGPRMGAPSMNERANVRPTTRSEQTFAGPNKNARGVRPPPSAQIGLERQKPGHPETIQGLFAICYLQCPYSDALSTEPAWDLVASALSLGARGRVSHRGVKTARAWR